MERFRQMTYLQVHSIHEIAPKDSHLIPKWDTF